ncbi:MAG: hypothetical protein ACT4PS_12020 [Betaproteobacteria bacterium]
MFRSGHIRRVFALLLTGGLLFAQASFAMRPCADSAMSAAAAVAQQSSDSCCGNTAMGVNLCVMRCADDAKLPAYAKVTVPPTPVKTALTPPFPAPEPPRRSAQDYYVAEHVCDPPKSVLFCSYLI